MKQRLTYLRLCGVLVASFALALPSGVAFAGQATEASIIGQVTDESGAVLPGVTVSATSPALQRDAVSISSEQGEYRLSPLPIGTYEVTYSLAGFQTVKRENVRLTVGFVAKLDAVLKVGSLSETINVSGASPVVDVTSTATSTQLTKETLELIPTTRNGLVSLAQQSPGLRSNLDVGGSGFATVPSFRAYGLAGETWQTIEGVWTSPPAGSGSGNYWDYSSFEETRVEAIGKRAEVPARGASIAAILKSGGNDFHGGGYWGGTSKRFQANNIDDALAAQGIAGGNKLEALRDVSGELGGRILRNKLWFFGSARERFHSDEVLSVFQPDGSPGVFTQRLAFHTEKLSYQANPVNRIVGFYSFAHKREVGENLDSFNPWESRRDNPLDIKVGKIEWQAVKGNVVASLQYGHWDWYGEYAGHSPGLPSTMDIRTLQISGDAPDAGNRPREWRHHSTGAVSWYKSNWLLGNHELKTGFDYLMGTTNRGFALRESGDYQLLFDNGVPFQIVAFNSPTSPRTATEHLGIYALDNWTIARRVTLNVGARVARDNGYVPSQCRDAGPFDPAACIEKVQFNIWNSVAPRLSAAYDVFGTGKTAIKGGWGRFAHMRETGELITANPFVSTLTTFTWHDLNGNKRYELGEVNINPNGPDFVSTRTREGGGRQSGGVPDANEQQPTVDQFYLSVEQELIPNFAVRATGLYSRVFNVSRTVEILRPYDVYNIPITNADPGPDGVLRTGDDPGTTVTYWDYPAAYAGSQFQLNSLRTVGQDQHFKSIEVSANKRFSAGWQLNASYSATKRDAPAPERSAFNPNVEIFAADHTWEWLGRVSGAYVFPYQVTASANFDHRSGEPQARQVLFRGGVRIPSLALNVEPIGSIRLPNTNVVDLRVEKAFRVRNAQKLSARLNIYNALNANTTLTRTIRSGATYLRPITILSPRILELSATYSF